MGMRGQQEQHVSIPGTVTTFKTWWDKALSALL